MSFTYLLSSSDATAAAIARVRLELGDTVESAGILPDGGNLSDEEIAVYLARGNNDPLQAASYMAGLMARRWATVADVTVGPRSEKLSQVALAWERQAASLAGGEAFGAFSLEPIRTDGYTAAAGGTSA